MGSSASSGDEPASDLAKAGEISGVSGVVNGVLAAAQHVAAVAAVRILEDARSPMPRGHVRDVERAVAIGVPPLQFDNFFEAQIGDQVEQDDGGRQAWARFRSGGGFAARWCAATGGAGGRSARASPGRDPSAAGRAGSIPVDAGALSTNSQRAKLGSMTTFCPPICRKKLECPMKVTPSSPFETSLRLVGLAGARRDRGMPHQARELPRSLAQSAIFQRGL